MANILATGAHHPLPSPSREAPASQEQAPPSAGSSAGGGEGHRAKVQSQTVCPPGHSPSALGTVPASEGILPQTRA